MKTYMLCSPEMPSAIRVALSKASGCICLEIPCASTLPAPVRHHPDMLFFNFPRGSGTVVAGSYYDENTEFFDGVSHADLIVDRIRLGDKYPCDIALDALAVDEKTLVCLKVYTSEAVRSGFERIIDVKQGYAACSTLMMDGKAAITADPAIYEALTQAGVDTLKIGAGGIELPGYGYGFIGGASAIVNGKVFFFGGLAAHADGEAIRNFCHAKGYECVDFPDFPLTDLGGVRYLSYM